MEFNEKLVQLRTQKGLTQEQLAEKVCVSRVAVSKWESGRGYPNLDSLKKLAKVFEVSIDQLLSADQLFDIAEVQTENTNRSLRTLIFGMADCLTLLLCILPLFANRSNGTIKNVSLLQFTEGPLFLRILFPIIVGSSGLLGITELALQNVWCPWKQKGELLASGVLSSLGIVIFCLTNQPYPSVFLFALFLVKVFSALKVHS